MFTDESYFYANNEKANALGEKPQASAVVIDPWTGHVKGVYGGAEKKGQPDYNRATQAARQPGSSFKPIVVYALPLTSAHYSGNNHRRRPGIPG